MDTRGKLTFLRGIPSPTTQLAFDRLEKDTLNVYSRVLPQYSKLFRDGINNAIIRADSGMPLKKAVKLTAKSWAENGRTTVTYKNGKVVSAESYLQMATKTELTNLHLETQLGRMQDYGMDLVQISDHGGSCQLCEPYEGKIFSVSGMNDKYPALDTAIDGGLYHPNCRHFQFPYLDLDNTNMPTDETGNTISDSKKEEVLKYKNESRKSKKDINELLRQKAEADDTNILNVKVDKYKDYTQDIEQKFQDNY